MYILPAIDLKDGKVVRLYKGDFNTVHQVAQDPLETARAFSEAGARWIHMVDLDGARGGTRINGGIVAEVTARSGLQVELGGRHPVHGGLGGGVPGRGGAGRYWLGCGERP